MSGSDFDWKAGTRADQLEIERALVDGFGASTLVNESARRSVHAVERADDAGTASKDGAFAVKLHHTRSGRHRVRESLKRWLGQSPASREWRALRALHECDVPVPRPRAWGRLRRGDEVVVSDFETGQPIDDAYHARPAHERTELLEALARAISRLHASGYRHGDLHLGNLWAQADRVLLFDLQRARRPRTPWANARARQHDLACLEFSMARSGWRLADRNAFRALLGAEAGRSGALIRFLRDYARGRGRRVFRIGRNWARAEVDGFRGLRHVSLSAETLTTVFEVAANDPNPAERRDGRIRITEAKADDRLVIVKQVHTGGLLRALSDRVRGSVASRAFRAGQRTELISPIAARPLAFLERSRFALPVESWLVMERVGEEDFDRVTLSGTTEEKRVAEALGRWLANMHRFGLSHRDLKASNIRFSMRPDNVRFWLVDLEDLRGPSEISDRDRLHALSQLNASLSEDDVSRDARLAALDAYRAESGISMSRTEMLSAIVRESLARGHRWQGRGCDRRDARTAQET